MIKRIVIFATIAFLSFCIYFIYYFIPIPILVRPHFLSSKIQTIEVQYVSWMCKCADFIETNKFKSDPIQEGKGDEFIFIEPSDFALKLDSNFYDTGRFVFNLRLTGSFYLTKGVPESSYPEIVEGWPENAKVFKYHKIEFIPQRVAINSLFQSISFPA